MRTFKRRGRLWAACLIIASTASVPVAHAATLQATCGSSLPAPACVTTMGEELLRMEQRMADPAAQAEGDDPAPASDSLCGVPSFDDRCERWKLRRTETSEAIATVVAGDGAVVVAGWIVVAEIGQIEGTVTSYDPESGATRWSRRVRGTDPAAGGAMPLEITASPDGSTIYAASAMNWVYECNEDSCWLIALDVRVDAFDASTGDVLWSSTYDGGSIDGPVGIAATQDSVVTVIATALGDAGWGSAMLTNEPSTGAVDAAPVQAGTFPLLAVASTDLHRVLVVAGLGQVYSFDPSQSEPSLEFLASTSAPFFPSAVAVSPDGETLSVAGFTDSDWVVVSVDIGTGNLRWTAGYVWGGWGIPKDVVVSRTGTVFLTGFHHVNGGKTIYCPFNGGGFTTDPWDVVAATLALDGSDGAVLWTKERGYAGQIASASAIAVSPDASRVYVAATASYPTGYMIHLTRCDRPGPGPRIGAAALVLFPTGDTYDANTSAYDAATGDQLWIARPMDGIELHGRPNDMAVDPADGSIYVVGATAYADPYLFVQAYGEDGNLGGSPDPGSIPPDPGSLPLCHLPIGLC